MARAPKNLVAASYSVISTLQSEESCRSAVARVGAGDSERGER
jgi:hypothetical protein